jgi:membrane associated rhomboid family serine protease
MIETLKSKRTTMERNGVLPNVLMVVIPIWVVSVIDFLLPIDLNAYGLIPRTSTGLIGILTMPFLHHGWGHLISNTFPLCLLLFLLASSRRSYWEVVASILVFGGLLLWCVGRSAVHVGASGLIYGLVAFLIGAGWFERNWSSLATAIIVGFLYGTTLLFGVLPIQGANVSWDGHLCGAIAGGLTAYAISRNRSVSPTMPTADI